MPSRFPRRKKTPREVTPQGCLISDRVELPAGLKLRRKIHPNLVDRRDPMFDWIKGAGVFVEVGSQWGWLAYRAAKNLPECMIYCVDPWWEDRASAQEWEGAHNFYEWQENIKEWLGWKVLGLRGTSLEVVDFFKDGSIDAVFIDADHSTDGVTKDLLLWVPKVKKGGVILGHDWDGIWGKFVRPAVMAYFEPLGATVTADLGYCGKKGERMSPVWKVEKTWD